MLRLLFGDGVIPATKQYPSEAPTTDPTHPPLNPKRRIDTQGKPSEAYAVLWVTKRGGAQDRVA